MRQPPIVSISGVVLFPAAFQQGNDGMHTRLDHRLAVVLLLAGCASSPRSPEIPAPASPVPTSPVPTTSGRASWTFSFSPGPIAYRISRSASIENRSDSASRHEVSTNITHELITLQPIADTLGFTAAIDTFSTTTEGITGATQLGQLPSQLTGSITSDSLIIPGDTLGGTCNPLVTALVTDVHNLLPRLPESLTTNQTWRDSTSLAGCQGSIPTKSRVIRVYRVMGGSVYENTPVLLLQRTDTIHAEGEGAQLQHRILLDANGSGTATYYLDTSNGQVLHLTVNQDLELTITASGKANRFRQVAKQEFALLR